jgi:hypothetical protein
MADTMRRDELRLEMVKVRPFMQPGDMVTATLEDTLRQLSLGGQENPIAATQVEEARHPQTDAGRAPL